MPSLNFQWISVDRSTRESTRVTFDVQDWGSTPEKGAVVHVTRAATEESPEVTLSGPVDQIILGQDATYVIVGGYPSDVAVPGKGT